MQLSPQEVMDLIAVLEEALLVPDIFEERVVRRQRLIKRLKKVHMHLPKDPTNAERIPSQSHADSSNDC